MSHDLDPGLPAQQANELSRRGFVALSLGAGFAAGAGAASAAPPRPVVETDKAWGRLLALYRAHLA